MSTERAELYKCRPPEGIRVSLLVHQSYIEYGIPTEAEVASTVRLMKVGRAGGASGMCAEYLKGCLWEKIRNNKPVRRR